MQLSCFDEACPQVQVSASLTLHSHRWLARFEIVDSAEAVRWPAQAAAARTDHLWEHTCLEMFVGSARGTSYFEINAGPHGPWNVYRFGQYRQENDHEPLAAAIVVGHVDSGIERTRAFDVGVQWLADPPLDPDLALVSLTAVVELKPGRCTYFAASHGQKPDFHDRRHWLPLLQWSAAR